MTPSKGAGDKDKPYLLIDNLFGGENQPLRASYVRLSEFLKGLGKDIHCKPCKTSNAFYRNMQFLIAKPKKRILYLGIPALTEKSGKDLIPTEGLGFPEKYSSPWH